MPAPRLFVVESPAIRPLSDGSPLRFDTAATTLRVKSSPPDSPMGVVETDLQGDDAENFLETMKNRGQIVSYREMHTDYLPAGDIWPLEVNMMGVHFPVCGVTEEWQAKVKYGEGIKIGIADTGSPPDAARRQFFPWVVPLGGEDAVGHGTAVGSIAGGVEGVLREATLVFTQALPGGRGSELTVGEAIKALADYGVDIINLSLGGSPSGIIDGWVRYAQERGIPCGSAAGNGGYRDQPGSPARASQFVWGATTIDGKTTAVFSSGGNDWEIETAAVPGDGVGVAHLDGGYGVARGTSFAAPMANAMVAALKKYGR